MPYDARSSTVHNNYVNVLRDLEDVPVPAELPG